MTSARRRSTAAWTLALAAAVLWPGHVLSPLDGAPLNGRAEAVLIGVVLPALWWIDRDFLRGSFARALIAALLFVKIASAALLPQHGLCARFSTVAPLIGVVSTIQVEEPAGILRSWDVRADARQPMPRCTAILDRRYESRDRFPSWFLNLIDGVQPRATDVALDVDGYVTVAAPGTLTLETGKDMTVAGTIDGATIAGAAGARPGVPLPAGSHQVQLRAMLTGRDWRLVPLWNGRDAWTAARFTVTAPGAIDGALWRIVAFVTPALVLLIVAAWSWRCVVAGRVAAAALAFGAAAAALFAALAVYGTFERYAALLLLAAVLLPLARRDRNVRSAFALVGVPWIVFFVARSWDQIGRVTMYSLGDDWQMYQVAAYRIFMNGYWIQGGSPTFYFQPFYRWIAGALHILFGDSSVGEMYWDAACLLAAALTCFAIVKRIAGYRWAIGAAALTLATFTVTSSWYLIGRGLSEISAVGFMSAAAMFLMRARLGSRRLALAAGACAVVMFFTRLNHLLLAVFFVAWVLPLRTPAQWAAVVAAVRRVRAAPVAVYVAGVAAGVVLFAAHTWWYAGHFSVVYGTSFGPQQTGLRPSTIASPLVWRRIAEAFGAQLSMREPPAVDPRAALVAIGAVLSALALMQVPYANRLPAPLAIVTVGTIAGSFFAHTHEYPGRMSVHVVPFAVAVSVCAVWRLAGAWARRRSPSYGAATPRDLRLKVSS